MVKIEVTAEAKKKLIEAVDEMSTSSEGFVRVAVLPGGCSGFQYGLNIEESSADDDEVIELEGVTLLVDPFSAQYLDGVIIDYLSSAFESGFVFENPNASAGCGCGSSFTV